MHIQSYMNVSFHQSELPDLMRSFQSIFRFFPSEMKIIRFVSVMSFAD